MSAPLDTTRMLLAVAAHCSKSDPPLQDGKILVDSLLQLFYLFICFIY